MKLPPWNRDLQRWDKYQAFHISVNTYGLAEASQYQVEPFVLFDTGEVICHLSWPRPPLRGMYDRLNVEVVLTNDQMPALRTPDGLKLKRAWLGDPVSQYLLIDHDTGHVVKLANNHWSAKDNNIEASIPVRLGRHRPTAYFAGEGRPPVGAPVSVALPHRFLSKEEREHIDMLYATCRAALRLMDYSPLYPKNKLPFARAMKVSNFQELTTDEKHALFFGVRRKVVSYVHLELDR